ncbi:unnamed protein product [Candidula unifasciata]|uniref:Enoyl reductase (ER) domain-containing protein n=1 Tax=Candidula unifasciata TaxID=100452 RepID=A0A8S3YPC2_9EUPU|nr:unnamed protein product [Candidula unifasciata]
MSVRAVRVTAFGGPEVLKLETIPKPTPKQGEVLIRVYSSGVNPCDTYIRRGDFSLSNVPPPFVTGLDGAGVVEEVGQGVTEFKAGDRVYIVGEYSGTCADYTVAPVRNVASLSDQLSFAQGSSIGIPYYTAYKSLYTLGRARPGETVLIHGASGAVGTAAIQIAVANGQRVLGTAGSEKGLELVKKLGADQVFNHREEGYTDKILEATGGKGVDVILEMLANVNLDKDLDIVAFRGRVVIVGSRGNVEISPNKSMVKESTVVGCGVFYLANESEWTEIKAALNAGQKVGWLVPVVAKEYRLEDVAQAHTDVINNSGTLGKLVVNVAGN